MDEAKIIDNGPSHKMDDSSSSQVKSCALCGCSTPAVRCDKCNSQIFCLSCDDMYHRHPKRRLHLRKAVDSIWTSARSPRLRRRTDIPGDPLRIPIPPPRTKKREKHSFFLKPNFELGSFGFSNVRFDKKTNLDVPKTDRIIGQKSLADTANYENNAMAQGEVNGNPKMNEIYENEDALLNQEQNMAHFDGMQPNQWNMPTSNFSSPIQVSHPSSSPEMFAHRHPTNYPLRNYPHKMTHSQSTADLSTISPNPHAMHPYFPHPYPYMNPAMHFPYSHSMAHLNCPQCLSLSWSNVMGSHASPYFHPLHWGTARPTSARGDAPEEHMRHHQDHPLNMQGLQAMQGNELHQQPETQTLRKNPSSRDNIQIDSKDDPIVSGAQNTDIPELETTEDPVNAAEAVDMEIDDAVTPEKPTEPWSCAHCTFINPPGIHVCQVCCKTSYKRPGKKTKEISADNKEGESPAQRNDVMASASFSDVTEAEKVI